MLTVFTGRSQAAPVTAFLRVPLEWYKSHTISFLPDETHTSIRRTFTPVTSPHTKRIFCGVCGTPLSTWSEKPSSEADFLSVTLGSLLGEDLRSLDDLGLIPQDVHTEDLVRQSTAPANAQVLVQRSVREGVSVGGVPWFEEMIEGSKLGRAGRIRRGHGGDSSTYVEWEVSEWTDEGTPPVTGKRKLDDEDADMSAPM